MGIAPFHREIRLSNSSEIEALQEQRHPCIYLVGHPSETIAFGLRHGLKTDKFGAYFKREDAIDLVKLSKALPPTVTLPRIAWPVKTPLILDMIPATSWGSNLANMLTPGSWDEVKNGSIDRAGNVCMLCRYCSGHKLRDAHEIWGYFPPKRPGHMGRQKYRGVTVACVPCHETYHPGLANSRGRLDIALERYRAITGPSFTFAEADSHFRDIGDRFLEHTKSDWALDFEVLAKRFGPDNPLVVKGLWQLQEDQSVYCESKESTTVLAGVHWKNPGKDSPTHFLSAAALD